MKRPNIEFIVKDCEEQIEKGIDDPVEHVVNCQELAQYALELEQLLRVIARRVETEDNLIDILHLDHRVAQDIMSFGFGEL